MTSKLHLLFLTFKQFTVISICLLLTACNGQSTDTSDDDINFDTGKIVQVDLNSLTGQSAELALFYPDDDLNNISWRQTDGEPVTLLTKNSKVIAFTPQTAGNYGFEVSFSLNNGVSQTLSHNISVSAQENQIATRLAHTVLSDNKVSLRVFTGASIDKSSIQWQQTAGPQVTFNQDNVMASLRCFLPLQV